MFDTEAPVSQSKLPEDKIITNYLKEFDGDMVLSEPVVPDNLDPDFFDKQGHSTEKLLEVTAVVEAWVREVTTQPFMLSLIGSYASGKQKDSSDIDIHVAVPGLSFEMRNKLIDELFKHVGAKKAADNFFYEKEPKGLDFLVHSSPPIGEFYNMSQRKWQCLSLKESQNLPLRVPVGSN
jgi:predicted nucleotidyltransferase